MQLRAAIGLGLGETIDELVVSDPLEPLQGEGGSRAGRSRPVRSGLSILIEASSEKPPPWCQPAMSRASAPARDSQRGEPAQHPSAHLLLHRGEVFRGRRVDLGEMDLPVLVHRKHPVDHAAGEMDSGLFFLGSAKARAATPLYATLHSHRLQDLEWCGLGYASHQLEARRCKQLLEFCCGPLSSAVLHHHIEVGQRGIGGEVSSSNARSTMSSAAPWFIDRRMVFKSFETWSSFQSWRTRDNM